MELRAACGFVVLAEVPLAQPLNSTIPRLHEINKQRINFFIDTNLSEQLGYRRSLHQLPRLVQVIIHNGLRFNPKAMINRRQ
jgi:hypothetical protein